jgi:hypothetical protein
MQSPVLISHSLTLWSDEAVMRYLTQFVITKQSKRNAVCKLEALRLKDVQGVWGSVVVMFKGLWREAEEGGWAAAAHEES